MDDRELIAEAREVIAVLGLSDKSITVRLADALAEAAAARERTERALRRTIDTEWGQVHAWHMDMIGELPPADLDAVVLSLYAAPPEPATPTGDA